MADQLVVSRVVVKGPVLAACQGKRQARGNRTQGLGIGLFLGQDALVGAEPAQAVPEGINGGEGLPVEQSHRKIQNGETVSLFRQVDPRQEIVTLGVEDIALGNGSRRHHAGDVPLHDALGGGRIFNLITDRNLHAGADEFGQVALRGMVGNPAHRHVVALGQGNIKHGGGALGVIEEHLVEIAKTEEQNRIVRDTGANAPILLHHRSLFLCHRARYPKDGPGTGLGGRRVYR